MENAENPVEEVYEQEPVEAAPVDPLKHLGDRFKEIADQMMLDFNKRVDALDKKYTDLRHTLTRQIDVPASEEPEDWSWENLRETMFPRETAH